MGVYVGDKRYAPYVGSTRRKVMTEKALPYDAEIMYLESTGTQYIDTGVVPKSATRIVQTGRYVSTGGNPEHGIIVSGKRLHWGIRSAYFYCGINTSYQNCVAADKNSHTFEIDGSGKAKIDSTEYTISASGISDSTFSANIFLYARNTNGSAGNYATFIMSACKIYANNTLLRDFIPVRVGQVGYMYDKISGQLFGNSGTGDFILGNDKN